MGQVFKARHRKLGRVVALKIIRKERLAHPHAVRRFQREVRAAAQLDHPNIVRALDADRVGETYYFAMEYVAGTDLARRVQEGGPLPVAEACEYVRQAAAGLRHAHEKGLIHRDVKPHNLMVSADPRGQRLLKLLDLGLALLQFNEDETTDSALTQQGFLMGTVDYLAPEQAINSHAVDARADLYSLGCTFYHLLTGRVPFPAEAAMEKLLAHRLHEPTLVESLRPDTPPGVATIVRRLMAKHPEDRFQTAAELSAALEGDAALPAAGPRPLPWWLSVEDLRPGALGETLALAELVGPADPTPLPRTRRRPASPGPTVAVAVRPITPSLLGDHAPCRPGGRRLPRKGLLAAAACLGAGLLLVLSLSLRPARRPAPTAAAPPPWSLDALQPDARARRGQEIAGLLRVLGPPEGRPAPDVRAVVFLRDCRQVVAGGDGPLCWWDVEKGEVVRRVAEGDAKGIVCVALSPDGASLATGGADGGVSLWTAGGDRRGGFARRHRQRVAAVAFAPNGRTLASAGQDGQVILWDVETFRPRGILKESPNPVFSLAFSPDGSWLAAGCEDACVRLWDLRGPAPREAGKYRGHRSWVHAVAFGPDGRALVSGGGGDGDLKLCELKAEGPVEVRDFRGSGKVVRAVAFTPDGRAIVTADDGGRIACLDLAGGRRHEVKLPGPVLALSLAADGRHLATANHDGTVSILRLPR